MEKVTKAVIPAAGLGTRLLPATKSMPKEMLTIVDRPVIQYVVEEAVASGLDDIIIITGRNKRAIEDHFDRNVELEDELRSKEAHAMLTELEHIESLADIHYIRQREPKGLAHAVACAQKHVGGEPFVVMLGDTIVKANYCTRPLLDLYAKYERTVIAVEEVEHSLVSQYGIIGGTTVYDGLLKVNKLVEKPAPADSPSNLAIFGRYVFPPSIFDEFANLEPGKGGELQLTDAIARLAQKEDVYAYTIREKRYDIGKKLNYVKAFIDFSLEREDIGSDVKEYLKSKY
jgi:UTP--glucose-1-phosphate uridylyltransferase